MSNSFDPSTWMTVGISVQHVQNRIFDSLPSFPPTCSSPTINVLPCSFGKISRNHACLFSFSVLPYILHQLAVTGWTLEAWLLPGPLWKPEGRDMVKSLRKSGWAYTLPLALQKNPIPSGSSPLKTTLAEQKRGKSKRLGTLTPTWVVRRDQLEAAPLLAGLQGLGCWVPPDPTCCLLPRSPLASGPGLLACPPLIISSLLLGAKLSETSSMRSKSKLTLPVLQYLWWARCSQVRGSGKGPLLCPESKTVTEPTCYFFSQFISFL